MGVKFKFRPKIVGVSNCYTDGDIHGGSQSSTDDREHERFLVPHSDLTGNFRKSIPSGRVDDAKPDL